MEECLGANSGVGHEGEEVSRDAVDRRFGLVDVRRVIFRLYFNINHMINANN